MRTRTFGVLRWLLPWAWALTVSTAIAAAAGQGLEHVLRPSDPPPQHLTGAGAPRQIQIVVLHQDRPSTVLECRSDADRAATDVLEVWDASDMQAAVGELCTGDVVVMDDTRRPH